MNRRKFYLPALLLIFLSIVACAANGVGSRNSELALAGKMIIRYNETVRIRSFEQSPDINNVEHQHTYTTKSYDRAFEFDFSTKRCTLIGTRNTYTFDYNLRERHLRICILASMFGDKNIMFVGEFENRHGEWLEGEFWGRLSSDSESAAEIRSSYSHSELREPWPRSITDVKAVQGEILRSSWGRALRIVPRPPDPGKI